MPDEAGAGADGAAGDAQEDAETAQGRKRIELADDAVVSEWEVLAKSSSHLNSLQVYKKQHDTWMKTLSTIIDSQVPKMTICVF